MIKQSVVGAISIVVILVIAIILNFNSVIGIKDMKIMTEKIIMAEYQNDMEFIKKKANLSSIGDLSLLNMSHLTLQSIDKIDVKIHNNTAVVTATITSSDALGYSDQYYEEILLVKINGNWEINSITRDT